MFFRLYTGSSYGNVVKLGIGSWESWGWGLGIIPTDAEWRDDSQGDPRGCKDSKIDVYGHDPPVIPSAPGIYSESFYRRVYKAWNVHSK